MPLNTLFGPGAEPLVRDEAQERFWELQSTAGLALQEQYDAQHAVEEAQDALNAAIVARDRATARYALANAEIDAHLLAHPDRGGFHVFRPEDIERAFSHDVEPLWPNGFSTDSETEEPR
jgi:hypothetical protein